MEVRSDDATHREDVVVRVVVEAGHEDPVPRVREEGHGVVVHQDRSAPCG